MNELIKVSNKQFRDESIPTVDARELHSFLQVGKDFSTWIKSRIDQYEFVENSDFLVFTSSGENLTGGRPSKEYAISIDMAKELSMVERNERGKQARQYFIECEHIALAKPAPTLPSTYLDALKELVATVEAKQQLEAENGVLRPKALIVDRINDAEGLHTMSEAAKILGTGRTRLFQFLRQQHIFDCHNMPLQQYIPNRFVVKERPYMRGDERSVYAQVYVTGRGITWLTPKVAGLGPDGQGEFFE